MSEDNSGIWLGILIGAGLMLGFVFCGHNYVNIVKSPNSEIIDVVKICKFSDGTQYVETTGYFALLGFRIADNETYSDPHHYISKLGKNEIKCTGWTIDAVLTTIDHNNL